ncbi:unnamed protein product [Protopolystoma xenopodis]|uniref:Uncharacterized protein n=1 Tax=Protopolystoma xenopodis TaxID=117903 RepID=A0A448WX85_9PLAT|nr:unnamed protein product [Protopolystoma xenopodis]
MPRKGSFVILPESDACGLIAALAAKARNSNGQCASLTVMEEDLLIMSHRRRSSIAQLARQVDAYPDDSDEAISSSANRHETSKTSGPTVRDTAASKSTGYQFEDSGGCHDGKAAKETPKVESEVKGQTNSPREGQPSQEVKASVEQESTRSEWKNKEAQPRGHEEHEAQCSAGQSKGGMSVAGKGEKGKNRPKKRWWRLGQKSTESAPAKATSDSVDNSSNVSSFQLNSLFISALKPVFFDSRRQRRHQFNQTESR